MLDKGRATLGGKHGDFHYNCPLDQQFLTFAGLDAEQIKQQLATGKGDREILEWITQAAAHKRSVVEIQAWSAYQEQRVPGDLETRKFFTEYHEKLAPHRSDVWTWFDILDIDDFVSFGGKA
jgi:hypothetical protein